MSTGGAMTDASARDDPAPAGGAVGRGPGGRLGGTPGGCPGWAKLLLVLSLAANLAVAGVVLGHGLRDDDDSKQQVPGRWIDWIVGMVPEDARPAARAHFADVPERFEALRDERAAHLPAVVAAMQAEPFDAAALDSALDTMFDREHSGRPIMRERMIAMLADLDPADRAVFAERFRERLSNRD